MLVILSRRTFCTRPRAPVDGMGIVKTDKPLNFRTPARTGINPVGPHSIRRVEIRSIRDVAMGSIARLSHQATSSPKLWLSR
jgi:hypothetical protein